MTEPCPHCNGTGTIVPFGRNDLSYTFPIGYTNSVYRVYDVDVTVQEEESGELVRLYGNWIDRFLYYKIIERLIKFLWNARAKLKYHAKNLFLATRPFDIRQPCWSSNRWKSLT